MSRYNRPILAQYRCGILPLNIEVGRYRNIPLDNRLCTLCPNRSIEDEFHFLCTCPIYNDIRSILYETIMYYDDSFIDLDDIDKFFTLIRDVRSF